MCECKSLSESRIICRKSGKSGVRTQQEVLCCVHSDDRGVLTLLTPTKKSREFLVMRAEVDVL